MGVRVKSGKLFVDFRWRGVRCREFTGLPATPENKQRSKALLKVIEGEIELRTFDYRKHFPHGARLREFYPDLVNEAGKDNPLVKVYLQSWHQQRSPFRPDGSVIEDADINPTTWLHDESVIRKHLIPAFGHHRLREVTSEHCLHFKRRLVDSSVGIKTATNILGVLHKAMEDAVDARPPLLQMNPVPKLKRKRGRGDASDRKNSDPLTSEEVQTFVNGVDPWFFDLYDTWFRLGWRPSELMALRFTWLDFHRQAAQVRLGRSPRQGGIEARPKTGAREVDCRYDPAIFAAFERRRRASLQTGRRDYVFTDREGKPLSQEWLHKRVWLPTLRRCGLRERGQYNIRDTFITLALSAGEDPGWVAQVCGTSERMIFKHYRKWMPSLTKTDGRRLATLYRKGRLGTEMGTRTGDDSNSLNYGEKKVEAGGIEPVDGSSTQRQRAQFQGVTRRHPPGSARMRQENRPRGPISLPLPLSHTPTCVTARRPFSRGRLHVVTRLVLCTARYEPPGRSSHVDAQVYDGRW